MTEEDEMEDEERTQLGDGAKDHTLQKGKGLIVEKQKFRGGDHQSQFWALMGIYWECKHSWIERTPRDGDGRPAGVGGGPGGRGETGRVMHRRGPELAPKGAGENRVLLGPSGLHRGPGPHGLAPRPPQGSVVPDGGRALRILCRQGAWRRKGQLRRHFVLGTGAVLHPHLSSFLSTQGTNFHTEGERETLERNVKVI